MMVVMTKNQPEAELFSAVFRLVGFQERTSVELGECTTHRAQTHAHTNINTALKVSVAQKATKKGGHALRVNYRKLCATESLVEEQENCLSTQVVFC